jgi:hypothetical protein
MVFNITAIPTANSKEYSVTFTPTEPFSNAIVEFSLNGTSWGGGTFTFNVQSGQQGNTVTLLRNASSGFPTDDPVYVRIRTMSDNIVRGEGTISAPAAPTGPAPTVAHQAIRVDLNVTVDAEGTISVFSSEEETVSNVIYAQVGIPATSFYDATASKGLIEFWEPSTALGDKAVAYKDKEEMAKLIASNLQNVLKGQMDAFEGSSAVASPFNDAKYNTNAEQYRKHSDFGRLALAAYAHYLFGHQAATAAITNDEAFMRGILSTDASGAWTKSTTGNVSTWSVTQTVTDANIALNLAKLIVTKSETQKVSEVTADSASLANIVRQVIGQDASRAMDQDNNALLPEMRQLLRFFPGDKIVVNIKLRAPTVTVGTGQKVGANTLVGLYDKDKVAANVQEENYSVVIDLE